MKFDYSIMIKKGIVYAVNYGAAYASVYGLDFTEPQKAVMACIIGSALSMLRNKIKMRWPETFGWL